MLVQVLRIPYRRFDGRLIPSELSLSGNRTKTSPHQNFTGYSSGYENELATFSHLRPAIWDVDTEEARRVPKLLRGIAHGPATAIFRGPLLMEI